VIAPAALGGPVLFGPNHGNAVEGLDLVAAGGGFIEHDATALAGHLETLRADPGPGRAAAAWVESRLGGAANNAALLRSLLKR
jgi:hypothetical protein